MLSNTFPTHTLPAQSYTNLHRLPPYVSFRSFPLFVFGRPRFSSRLATSLVCRCAPNAKWWQHVAESLFYPRWFSVLNRQRPGRHAWGRGCRPTNPYFYIHTQRTQSNSKGVNTCADTQIPDHLQYTQSQLQCNRSTAHTNTPNTRAHVPIPFYFHPEAGPGSGV